MQPLRKEPFQIIDKPTDVTYKLTDLNKKKSFNIEKIFYFTTQKSTHFENLFNYTLLQDLKLFKKVQNKIKIETLICKLYKNNLLKRKKNFPNKYHKNVDKKEIETERKNQKLEEKIIPQDQK